MMLKVEDQSLGVLAEVAEAVVKNHVVEALSVAELRAVHEPGINLGLVRRAADADITAFLQTLLTEPAFVIDTPATATPERSLSENKNLLSVRQALTALLAPFKSRSPAGYEKLLTDVERLAVDFALLTESAAVQLWFGTVRTDSCRFFHRDVYLLRLLCTYIGKGTEWLDNDNVRRSMLAQGSNEAVVIDASRIQRLLPFEVGVLKGEYGGRNTGNGIIHRSPPVEISGETRIVLRIDRAYPNR